MFQAENCLILTCRDVSQINEIARLEAENEAQSLVYTSFSHDLLTPLKCIIELAKMMVDKATNWECKKHLETVCNTSRLLLAYVKSHMD